MKNHKYTHKWYKPKDRKAIKQKRREHRQKKNVNDWNKINLHTLEQKKKKIVSSKDALKDTIPYLMVERSEG